MGKNSNIEWTNHTWNPWQGCYKVSAGCQNCYMFRDKKRFGQNPEQIIRSKDSTFNAPLIWKEPARVFVCSWSDFFLEGIDQWRLEAWNIMKQTPHLTYFILTKRIHLAGKFMTSYQKELTIHSINPFSDFPSNIWIGISAENQKMFDRRIDLLLNETIPFRKFVSLEPLLGPICIDDALIDNQADYEYKDYINSLHWVIDGGESMSNRSTLPGWFRYIRDACIANDVPYFHKQNGGTNKIEGAWGGRILDGTVWSQYPTTYPQETA